MNPDLLSANVSTVLMALSGGALLAHLTQIAGPHRFLHGIFAATATGLVYLFGERILGWRFAPGWALCGAYLLLFIAVALAYRRRGDKEEEGFPWKALLVQPAALAYIFAPASVWRPALSLVLTVYFLFDLFGWLKGREEVAESPGPKDHRPPLFPPKRIRGLREFAAAAAAAALVYVFAMGVGRTPVAPAVEEQASAEQAEPAATGSESAEAPAETEESKSTEPVQDANAGAADDTYVAKSGETLKSIARKVYGQAKMLATLAAANPGIKPGLKLKAGQVVKLPAKPQK
ncbi:LysM peptidoglycan-binding domain-containing protein [Methylocystis parvus]|uniref:LysM peptidoglycan-binding domain-containing protein n=1 Tax=Methylocystis parvus TaxID=134 RepID=UPI003C7391CF